MFNRHTKGFVRQRGEEQFELVLKLVQDKIKE